MYKNVSSLVSIYVGSSVSKDGVCSSVGSRMYKDRGTDAFEDLGSSAPEDVGDIVTEKVGPDLFPFLLLGDDGSDDLEFSVGLPSDLPVEEISVMVLVGTT